MNKLEEALQEKISGLEDEKEELEAAIEHIDLKLETYRELLAEETGEEIVPTPKKRGRPKKTAAKGVTKRRGRPKKKVSPEIEEQDRKLYEEAKGSLPGGFSATTDEEQEKAVNRFNPQPKGPLSHPGVTVGSTKGNPAALAPDPRGHKTISMEDDLPEEK